MGLLVEGPTGGRWDHLFRFEARVAAFHPRWTSSRRFAWMAFVTAEIRVWAPRPLMPFHERSSSCNFCSSGRSFPTATAPTLLTLFLERFRFTSGSAQSTAVWTIPRTHAFSSSLAPTFSQDRFRLLLKTWMSGLLLWGPRWFPLRSRETRLPPPREFVRSLHPLSPMRLSARLMCLIE